MALIKEYKSPQGATIRIYDDYMVKTKKENDAIISQVSRIINASLARQQAEQISTHTPLTRCDNI